jgi:GWxTD domain-containing protein
MKKKNHWLILCVFFFPQLLWALEDPPDVAYDQSNTESLTDAIEVLTSHLQTNPKDGDAWTKLGYIYLSEERLTDAKKAFDKGVRYAKSAEAYTGLGKVYVMDQKMAQKAFVAFRQALGVDPAYLEAQMQIALLHVRSGNLDAEKALRRVIEMDPTYAPGYRELILWYEQAHLNYEQEIVEYCEQYIARFPNDPMGYYHLTLSHLENHRYDEVLKISAEAKARFSDDMRWMPLVAQGYASRGDAERSLILFEEYLQSISEDERAYYNDLSLIATNAELETLESISEDEREDFLTRFWESREGAVMLGGDARRMEHYRRVWYARTFFGRKDQPWDRRGEVYIRYGEPDYRSRSGSENPIPGVAVQNFKMRKINELFGRTFAYKAQEPSRYSLPQVMPGKSWTPGTPAMIEYDEEGEEIEIDLDQVPLNEWLWEVKGPFETVHLNIPPGLWRGIEPVVPTERSPEGATTVPWESWVYLNIGDGLEFVFTDRYMSGSWDFPLQPNTIWHASLAMHASLNSPSFQLMQTVSELPEYFDVPPGVKLLEFYYDAVSFRGENERSSLEIYFGIPPEQISLENVDDRVVRMTVERTLVLADAKGDSIYRETDELVFEGEVTTNQDKGLFVELASLDVPPGNYTLGVKLADRISGRWGMYRQQVEIPAFEDSLAVSEIEMAYNISETSKPSKFAKGELVVIPSPTRSFNLHKDANLYYEVYNLKLDEFGQAKYRVTYTIHPNVAGGTTVASVVIGGLRRLFAGAKEPEFTIRYERIVNAMEEPVFFALETESLKPGLKMVEVAIDDLNSGQRVSRQAVFNVVASSAP